MANKFLNRYPPENDIDIKENSDPVGDDDIGPWIYKEPRPHPSIGYDRDLNDYCQRRVFCRTGYRADSCKTPIKCVPLSGGRRKTRKNKKSRRR